MSRALALAVGLGAAACFDPRAAQPCDGGACVVADGRRSDASAGGDGPSSDAPPAAVLGLREGLFLRGPGADVLSGVTSSGGFGPIVVGTYAGGSGTIGTTAFATDQGPGPGDVEGVVATINSLPLSYLPSLPLPTPSSDGSSGIRANKVAVDTTLGLVIAIGTSRVNVTKAG